MGTHFNYKNEMQLNPTWPRIKCMVRPLIRMTLSIEGNISLISNSVLSSK